MGRLSLGAFPIQQLGLLLGMALGPRYDHPRLGGEVQVFPVRIGRLHPGGFLEGGKAFARRDGNRMRAPFFGWGGLLQVDVTTRCAFQMRLGLTALFGEDDTDYVGEWTLGFAFY